jgi:hypothetical protein
MSDEVIFLLSKGYLPGSVLQLIDSVRYVKTTAGDAADILDEVMRRDRLTQLDQHSDRHVWLFAAGGQLSSTSIHGGSRGRAGTLWIIVDGDGTIRSGTVEEGVKVGPPYRGEEIRRGASPALDARRVAPDTLVRDFDDAVEAVANLLVELQASISSVSYVHTSARQAEALTGVAFEGNGVKSGAWVFDLRGNFQLICGGDFHKAQPDVRLLVYEGRSSPYVVHELPGEATPAPTPDSTLFVTQVMEPEEYPAIDRFRMNQSEIEAQATAYAGASIVLCPEVQPTPLLSSN